MSPLRLCSLASMALFAGACAERGTGSLEVTPVRLEFAPAYAGWQRSAGVLTLTNRGNSAAKAELSAGAPFLVAESAVLVPPRGATKVEVTFAPSEPGVAEGSLAVRANGGSVEVALAGEALTPPGCAPASGACVVRVFDPAAESCVEQPAPDGAPCQSGCVPQGACLGGRCVGALKKACDDSSVCTVERCEEVQPGVGVCLPAVDVVCPAAPNECQVSDCDQFAGCYLRHLPPGTECGPPSAPTAWAACWGGECRADSTTTPNSAIPPCGGVDLQDPVCIDGWCYENPLPGGGAIESIGGSGPDDVWFVQRGGALHWDGERLRGWDLPTKARLHDIAASSRDNVWAVGQESTLLKFDGTTWTQRPSPAPSWATFGVVWTDGPNNVWVGSADWSNPSFRWNGGVWNTFAPNETVVRFERVGQGDVWIAYASGWMRRWNGVQILGDQILSAGLRDLRAVGGRLLALTSNTVYERTSAGWDPVFSEAGVTMTGLFASGPDDIWIYTSNGAAYRYDGAAWTLTTSAQKGPSQQSGVAGGRRIWGAGRNDVWAVGDEPSEIYHWDGRPTASDAGVPGDNEIVPRWKPVGGPECGTTETIVDLHAVDASDLWAITEDQILRRTPAGWKPHPGPGGTRAGTWRAIWGAGSDVWVSTTAGGLYRWNGAEWASFASGTTLPIHALWGAGPSDIWAVGGSGLPFARHFDGASWSAVALPAGTTSALKGVWGSSSTDVYAITDGDALRWDGTAWSRLPLSFGPFRAVHGTGPNDVWILESQRVHRWNGVGWTSFWAPTSGMVDLKLRAPGDGWVAYWNGVLSFNSAGSWTTYQTDHFGGTAGPGVLETAGGQVWIAGGSGRILRLAQ